VAAEHSTRLSAAERRKAAIIAAVGSPLIGALASTWRWHVDGFHHYEAATADGRPPIFAFWHGRILGATCFWRDRGIVVMISENFDGEWIARIVQRFGYGTARGSSSRGGVRALVQLRRALASGRIAGFSVDGPRGPARVAQPGAAWLAGATGHPIVPFHIEAERFWTIGSWDRTQVPKPFSRMALTIGPPLYVRSTDESVIEEARVRLQSDLESLETRARSHLVNGPLR
jgi:lysophospholipid acyltransferase (LPLAT)-like uncharacterized protein